MSTDSLTQVAGEYRTLRAPATLAQTIERHQSAPRTMPSLRLAAAACVAVCVVFLTLRPEPATPRPTPVVSTTLPSFNITRPRMRPRAPNVRPSLTQLRTPARPRPHTPAMETTDVTT